MIFRYLPFLLAMCCLSGCDRETRSGPDLPVVVKTITVENDLLLPNRRFPAHIIASDVTDLAFKQNGVLKSILPREGSRVRKGDVIASLNDTEARLLLHKRASASDVAQRQFARYAELARRHLISQAELDLHRQQRDTALAALKLAQEAVSDLQLKAPFEGVIAKVHAKNHTLVQAGQPVVTMNRTDSLDVIFSMPERVIKALDLKNLHQPFQVELNALPGKSFPAWYKEHATNSDRGSLSWQMTLTLPRPAQWTDAAGLSGAVRLPPALYRITAGPVSIRIPGSALFSPEGNRSDEAEVWVVEQRDGGYVVEPRHVVLGQMTDAGIEITQGLQVGEKVVTAGVASLTPHQRVKLWQREPGL